MQTSGKMDLKEPYYRQLNSWWQQPAAPEAEGVAAGSHSQQDASPAAEMFAAQMPVASGSSAPTRQPDPSQRQQQQSQMQASQGWL